ncbi:MAG: FAD-dependent oxidoreductase [Spirochaetes bacterium]|nr:FAD-dependent oxidoreductase [Spirochaetota bacterium]
MKKTGTKEPAGSGANAAPRAIVVGSGLSGLTAAALLAERGFSVTVLEQQDRPGGAASAFRRGDVTYDTGAAMMFGFGERGFNPHRWLMTELGEPIEVYRHEAMYRLVYDGKPIVFHTDRARFVADLTRLFPDSASEISSFYDFLEKLYFETIAPVQVFEAPGDVPLSEMRKTTTAGLGPQLKMLSLLFSSTESLMRPYIKNREVRAFFDKLTSTYCYTTIRETPAILAATMFVDNHEGGAYYPAGSAMALAARLEKAVEARGGVFCYRSKVTKVLGEGGRITGVATADGAEHRADCVLYAGSLAGFAAEMDPDGLLPPRWKRRIGKLEMTMPSFVVYGTVKKSVIPEGSLPVQMFVDNREALDEGDVTIYLPSLEDPSLAPEGWSTFLLIGPSLGSWPKPGTPEYESPAYVEAKRKEADRMLSLVERRMPGFIASLGSRIEASPSTIWRYLGKVRGSVAGPKQKMGQHLILRQKARGPVEGLYFAGEATVMGTGTPAVTVSGISAANRILRDFGFEPFIAGHDGRSAVTIIPAGTRGNAPATELGREASRCRWCEAAPCSATCPACYDIPGIMRRIEAGNIAGASQQIVAQQIVARPADARRCENCLASGGVPPCETACTLAKGADGPLRISRCILSLDGAAETPKEG